MSREVILASKVVLSQGSGGTGSVTIGSDDSSDNTNALSIVSAQVVETSAPTIAHKYKIKINGVEYWIGLDPV